MARNPARVGVAIEQSRYAIFTLTGNRQPRQAGCLAQTENLLLPREENGPNEKLRESARAPLGVGAWRGARGNYCGVVTVTAFCV